MGNTFNLYMSNVQIADKVEVPTAGFEQLANTVQSYTLDELQSMSPTLTGRRVICSDLADAPFELAPQGVSMLAGDRLAANGRVWLLKELDNVRFYGATGDGVTDDYQAIQNAFNRNSKTVFPDGTYLVNTGLVKTGQFWTIEGQGAQQTIIKGGDGVVDILTLDIVGTIISRSNSKGLMIDTASSNKASGATYSINKKPTRC